METEHITYVNIISITEREFPEFVISPSDISATSGNERLPYIFYADFMRFVMHKVIEEHDTKLLRKLIRFTNGLFASSDVSKDVKNLIGVEVFENIVGNPKATMIVRPLLNQSSQVAFDRTMQYCGIDSESINK